jgi:hypothetical protein
VKSQNDKELQGKHLDQTYCSNLGYGTVVVREVYKKIDG